MFSAEDQGHGRGVGDKKPQATSSIPRGLEKQIDWGRCSELDGAWANRSVARDEGCYAQNLFSVNVRSNMNIK